MAKFKTESGSSLKVLVIDVQPVSTVRVLFVFTQKIVIKPFVLETSV